MLKIFKAGQGTESILLETLQEPQDTRLPAEHLAGIDRKPASTTSCAQ